MQTKSSLVPCFIPPPRTVVLFITMLEIRIRTRASMPPKPPNLTHQCLPSPQPHAPMPPSLTHTSQKKNQPNNNAQGAFAERTATCLQKWGGAALQCRSRGRRPAVGQPDPAAVHYHVCIYCTTSVYLPFSTVLQSLHGIALRSRLGNAGCVPTCADVCKYLCDDAVALYGMLGCCFTTLDQ